MIRSLSGILLWLLWQAQLEICHIVEPGHLGNSRCGPTFVSMLQDPTNGLNIYYRGCEFCCYILAKVINQNRTLAKDSPKFPPNQISPEYYGIMGFVETKSS